MTLPLAVERYDTTDQLFRNDLEHYCAKLARIQTKGGKIVPFKWREAQRQLHKRIEKQLDSRGLVRAIVLKARRLGVSTYVGARYYHRSSLWRGRNAFILTHEDKATNELFELVKLIHSNMPLDYRPDTDAANEKELAFAGMNGGYRVGTAHNTEGMGRGLTLQLFHGSEVAHWRGAEGHAAGIMKTVSLVPETEMILESTARGVGGMFYDQWGLAERGQSDFIPIFLPWTLDPDNARKPPKNYEPSAEEEEYQRLFKLTDEQLCWAHFENVNLGGEPGIICPLFRQENPATAAEAFQSATGDAFISPESVMRARRLTIADQSHMPRVLGVDVARNLGGGDQTRIIDRQGRKAGVIDERLQTDNTVVVANRIMKILRDNPNIAKAYIDITGGLGAGPYDICRTNGFARRVAGINFGEVAMDGERFVNKRAEMWGLMRDWLLDPGGADIPDDDEWQRNLCAPVHVPPDANSRIKLEAKERIKKRVGFSPDIGDALGLTFAEVLPVDMGDDRPKWMRKLEADHDDDDDASGWETA